MRFFLNYQNCDIGRGKPPKIALKSYTIRFRIFFEKMSYLVQNHDDLDCVNPLKTTRFDLHVHFSFLGCIWVHSTAIISLNTQNSISASNQLEPYTPICILGL